MAVSSLSAHSTLRALKSWAAHFGTPRVAESGWGVHFTATSDKMFCGLWDLQWSYHLAKNPTATGYIERFNRWFKRRIKISRNTREFSIVPGRGLLYAKSETDFKKIVLIRW